MQRHRLRPRRDHAHALAPSSRVLSFGGGCTGGRICGLHHGRYLPVSGRLFRLAGFRLESRELVMRALGIGGGPPEPRLRLHRLEGQESCTVAQRLLEDADLIIAALGYRPTYWPFLI